MIANITEGGFLKPLIAYNENKVAIGEAEIIHYSNSFKMGNFEKEYNFSKYFISSLGYNSNSKNKFFHVSLNFSHDDLNKISNKLLNDIAKEYLSELGFTADHPYLVYKHEDTLHPHIHIVTSKILENGKPIVSSNIKYRSQQITRNLEIKYDLTRVSSKKNSENIVVSQNLPIYVSLKNKLNYHLKFALSTIKVQGFMELENYLNDNSLSCTKITGIKEVDGIPQSYDGMIFNDFGIEFKQNQKGIKGSSLYLKPTYSNLDKIFTRNRAAHKLKKEQIKNNIDSILAKYDKISFEDFKKQLDAKNIHFNFKTDSNDRLVGVSFTDASNGCKYAGENIGKNYTAKNLEPFFGKKTKVKPEVITKILYHKYKNEILNPSNTSKEVENLIKLGINVQSKNGNLYISDYTNTLPTDFVLFRRNIDSVSPEAIQLIKKAHNLNFNNLSEIDILNFWYHRAKADNDIPKMNSISKKIDILNAAENTNETKVQPLKIDDGFFCDVIVTQENNESFNDNSISDADKKKKKFNLFRRKPRH